MRMKYYNVPSFHLVHFVFENPAIKHTCKSVICEKSSRKYRKKIVCKLAVIWISCTFAPAFGNEAVILDMLLQVILDEVVLLRQVAFPPFAWERPKRRAPSLWGLRKKTSKNIWWFENNSLPLHPLLRSEPRSRASKKNFEKSSAKIWRIYEKLLTFATAFR